MGGAHVRKRGAVTLGAVVAGMLLAGRPCAFALNPALDVSQYAHMPWKIRDGFSKGVVDAIAQTPDGYLWLGTEFGLLRFDGVRFTPWRPPDGQHLPNNYVRSLLLARNGTLWIGTGAGLASWDGARLTLYADLDVQSIWTLLEDREGTMWVGGQAEPIGKLCAIRGGKVQCYGEDGRFGQSIESLYEDRGGNLWVGGVMGLWRWKPGPPKRYPMPDSVQALMDGENGALLVAMPGGFSQFVDGKIDAYPLPVTGRRFTARSILRDRDGGLWIGTKERGLVHAHQGRTDVFERSDGLSGDFIERLFEDREGNIWVATIDGLDRFRDLAVPTISVKQGLSDATVESVLAAKDGSVWLGTLDGLNRWNNGRVTIYRKSGETPGSGLPDNAIESLYQDFEGQIWVSTRRGIALLENGRFITVSSVPSGVQAIAGDSAGNLWLSQRGSLFHLRGRRVVEQFPWTRLARDDHARTMITDPVGGGLWLGFQRGVAYFKDGQIRASYSAADGLGAGRVRQLRLDQQGALWAATEGGLSRLKDGRIATLSGKNGLPCDDVQWMAEGDDHFFWLYMACGLVRITRAELDSWAVTANQDPKRQVQFRLFDSSDGVRSHSTTTGFSPSVAKSADGKLWFLPWDGAGVLDPGNLPFNKLPPPVRIEEITADRKTYDTTSEAKGPLRLPPLIRNLEIDYTALSLVAPEKTLFRYKLEGRDQQWQDAGNRRQAFYSDLPPRNYRFRVAACNNSGVWNEAGTFLDFSVDPAYYQTRWFQALCAAAFLALLGTLYQLRLRQVARQFNMRLEERVNERTRIARDLHDTLLQSFQGVLMKFSVVADLIPARPAEARKMLEGVIEQARRAIIEGRDTVQALRSSTVVTNDLARAISAFGEELAANQTGQSRAGLRVRVEGASRDLSPLVRDEVHRIACEALRNAFRHAQAGRIEVEIHYDRRQLRLKVQDNGKGIDPKILSEGGSARHYGLPGMRERATRIGGKLVVLSKLDSGTEVGLTVPASVAYLKPPVAHRSMAPGADS